MISGKRFNLCLICKNGILISTALGCQIKRNCGNIHLTQSRHFHYLSCSELGRLLSGVKTQEKPLDLQNRMPAWPSDNLISKAIDGKLGLHLLPHLRNNKYLGICWKSKVCYTNTSDLSDLKNTNDPLPRFNAGRKVITSK